MKYKSGDVVDLDDFVPSPAAIAAWSAVAQQAATLCHVLGISEDDLPDEQAKLNADGSITIFILVTAPSGGTATFDMIVPSSEFVWK